MFGLDPRDRKKPVIVISERFYAFEAPLWMNCNVVQDDQDGSPFVNQISFDNCPSTKDCNMERMAGVPLHAELKQLGERHPPWSAVLPELRQRHSSAATPRGGGGCPGRSSPPFSPPVPRQRARSSTMMTFYPHRGKNEHKEEARHPKGRRERACWSIGGPIIRCYT